MSIFTDSIDLSEVDSKEWPEKYMGPGYRNCIYVTDHERNGTIILLGYDKVGNPKTFTCRHHSWIKYRVGYKTREKDVYGNYVETRYFRNVFDRRKFLDKADGIWIVEAFRPEQEFLMKAFGLISLEETFNKQPLRTHFIDIETEISDEFESPVNARNRINMITVYDTATGKYWTWSLEDGCKAEFHDYDCEGELWKNPLKEFSPDRFELRTFAGDETAMLRDWLDWHEANCPDVISGWNTQAYDIPYIVRRLENVLGETEAKRISPAGRYRIKEVNHDNERANASAEIEVDISGIFNADGLVLYRDKFKIAGSSLDGGYSLDNVGEHENQGRKIKYTGSLKNLYETDYQRFYEYNVRDVDLVRRVEEKVKMIPLARAITSVGLTNYDAIYSSIGYLIGSLSNFAKTEMKTGIFQSYLNEKKEGESYEGAYVFPPVVGFYTKGIATIDFNSLYPSCIRAANISPETYVGKVTAIKINENDEPIDLDDPAVTQYRLKPANGKPPVVLTKEKLKELIATRCIFTPNNTLFLKHSVKQGVISAWCRHFFNLRKATKKKMKSLELKLYKNEITDPVEKAAAEIKIQNLDGLQMAIKIMINSIYGVCGTSFSPTYNKELAQTITRMGKFCNMNAAEFIKREFKKRYNISDDYITAISGDTDSCFFQTKIYIKS